MQLGRAVLKSYHRNGLIKPSHLLMCLVRLKSHQIPTYQRRKWLNRVIFSSVGISSLLAIGYNLDTLKANAIRNNLSDYGSAIPGLKEYSKSEVSKHNDPRNGGRVWVIYKSGVYDITEFIGQHPGGEKILLGGGGDIEPFWNLYAVHKNDQVLDMLESYRIGNLRSEEVNRDVQSENDPYADDPVRPPYFSVRSSKPFNAEPPLNILVDSWVTPKYVAAISRRRPYSTNNFF